MNNENKKPTQCERVLRHLRDLGEISQLEALELYGIMRLASRINELKQNGHNISKAMKSTKNRYGEVVSFAVYKLEK